MVKVSDIAIQKLLDVLIEEQKPYIRFGLQGGGCSGFQYYFLVEETKEDDDFVIIIGDKEMLVDAASMMYLTDMEIDYKEELMQEGFVFSNPSAVSTCGCGSSASF